MSTAENVSHDRNNEEHARALILELQRRGVELRHENGQLLLTGPRGAMDERLQAELRAHKADIINRLRASDAASLLPEGLHPLSNQQQSMWYLESEQPDLGVFNLFLALDIRGPLDIAALEASLTELFERHEALRAGVVEHEGKPVQRIHPASPITLSPEPLDEDELQIRLTRETARGFDVMRAPLYRLALYRRAPDRHVLLLVLDHMLADGTSLAILKRELVELYAARLESRMPRVESLRARFVDVVREERRWLETPAAGRQLAYWKKQLAGELPVLDLPADYARPEVSSGRGECLALELSRDTLTALEQSARQAGASAFMLITATVAATLAGRAGQGEIVLGTPMANRRHPHGENVVGLFMNPAALRIAIDRRAPFAELLRQVRDRCLEALENQSVPFEKVVDALKLPRGMNHGPVFQALVTQFPGFDGRMTAGETVFESMNIRRGTAQTDISFWCREHDDGMCIEMEYSADLFTPQTAQSILDTFENMLAAVIGDLSQPVSMLPLLSDREREQLEAWTAGPARDWPAATVHDLVRECVERTPSAAAVHGNDGGRDYRTLGEEASRVAETLRAAGIGRGDIVGVLLERDGRLPGILLGVLEAGAAYLPIDPSAPAERVRWMLEDSMVRVVVTSISLAGGQAAGDALSGFNGTVIDADAALEGSPAVAALGDHSPATPGDPAYVIYTSGSTGKPKGVVVPHRAVANFLRAMHELLDIEPDDRFLALTTLGFDIAVLELWLPLAFGASTHIVPREAAGDGDALCEWIAHARPTVMQATPAGWQLLTSAGWQGDSRARLLCGGEALPAPLARSLLPLGRELWNVYGPTETTVWSTAERVSPGDDPVPVGQPIANTQVYVLDAAMGPVPPGAPGELYIGGDGVTDGYLNRPELTRERFVPDPFSPVPGRRLYRTGDRVRFDVKGRLEYLGRMDFQIKLRGHRIEPGEIEAVLESLPAVERAVVTVHQFDAGGEAGGDPRLVAYVVLRAGMRASVDQLREALHRQLPAYMLPQHFVALDVLPLNASGKVDRKALPAPATVRQGVHLPPVTATEQKLAAIWTEILGVDRAGRNDNFFDLGGHSLSSMEAVARIDSELGCRIRPRLLVLNTLEEIAAACDRQLEDDREESFERMPLIPGMGMWKTMVNALLGR